MCCQSNNPFFSIRLGDPSIEFSSLRELRFFHRNQTLLRFTLWLQAAVNDQMLPSTDSNVAFNRLNPVFCSTSSRFLQHILQDPGKVFCITISKFKVQIPTQPSIYHHQYYPGLYMECLQISKLFHCFEFFLRCKCLQFWQARIGGYFPVLLGFMYSLLVYFSWDYQTVLLYIP